MVLSSFSSRIAFPLFSKAKDNDGFEQIRNEITIVPPLLLGDDLTLLNSVFEGFKVLAF